jgi:hypothetical protein
LAFWRPHLCLVLLKPFGKYRSRKATGPPTITINGLDHDLGPHGTKADRIEYDPRITERLSSGRPASHGAPAHIASKVFAATSRGAAGA